MPVGKILVSTKSLLSGPPNKYENVLFLVDIKTFRYVHIDKSLLYSSANDINPYLVFTEFPPQEIT